MSNETQTKSMRVAQFAHTAPSFLLRSFVLIPIIATLAISLTLMIYGGLETIHFVEHVLWPEDPEHGQSHNEILFLAIEIVDLFLLATVTQVVSLGLFQLYFKQDLTLPNWLKIRTLDDLKFKLIGVIVTMMGVAFLGQVLIWSGDMSVIYFGLSVAAVTFALSHFLSKMHITE